MAKRLTTDESGDNDELQALFDSIASQADGKASAETRVTATADSKGDGNSGDSDELQALFDSVAADASVEVAAPAVAAEGGVNFREAAAASATLSFEERVKVH